MTLKNFLGAFADPINAVICLIITAFFAVGVILVLFRKDSHYSFRRYIPALCATTGVFGTFLGVFFGLLEFDPDRIQASFPPLLNGMKLAFATSIAGMLASILLKALYEWVEDSRQSDGTNELTILHKQRTALEMISTRLESVEKEIGAEQESTRQAISDVLSSIALKFSEVQAEQMRAIAKEFAASLDVLASKYFDDLKGATEKLIQWQNSYAEQLRQSEEHIQTMHEKFKSLEEHYTALEGNTRSLLSALQPAVQGIRISSESVQQQSQHFANILETLRLLSDKMQSIMPGMLKAFDAVAGNIGKMEATNASFVRQTESLLQHQHMYAEQVRSNEASLGKLLSGLTSMENRYSALEGKTHALFSDFAAAEAAMQSIQAASGTLHKQSLMFENAINPLISLGERVRDFAPEIQDKIKEITGQISRMQAAAADITQGMRKSMDEQAKLFTQHENNISAAVSTFIDKTLTDMGHTNNKFKDQMTDSYARLAHFISESSQNAAEQVRNGYGLFLQAFQEARTTLDEAAKTHGQSLEGISRKLESELERLAASQVAALRNAAEAGLDSFYRQAARRLDELMTKSSQAVQDNAAKQGAGSSDTAWDAHSFETSGSK